MKVLVTGGSGYVGSVLTNMLLQKGFQVKVIDFLWFKKDIPLINLNNPNYEFIKGDVRDSKLVEQCLHDVDFVIHTAAVVGDPASKKYPEITKEINLVASKNLINLARAKGIKGFFFFSTCSNYGVANSLATEESELKPLSLYAESKIQVEEFLINEVNDLDWIIGRLSTVYGSSPRMRFDLTVNDFTLAGFKDKKIDIFLPESYRPYIHVYDLANVIINLINNFEKTKRNVFNIGFNGENYQKIQIANAVKENISDLNINILKEGGDTRDYQVDFSKLYNFIGLKNNYNVGNAVKEILYILNNGLVSNPMLDCYYNTTPDL
ncbi:MAG: SDR family oxidoreductase [Candidatus Margulisiibacteriota bacterium]|jgi:nucleoside-diphosphate-sugar epimerase